MDRAMAPAQQQPRESMGREHDATADAGRAVDEPRVTVVIPTFNRALLLTEAIGSVLAQTYRDYEIVVCDDGSTDDTAARVHSCGSRVRYLRLDHCGRPGPARNRGIEAARGELIAFLDDDDLWEPDKLARQVALFDQQPALGLVYTNRRLLLRDGSYTAPVITPPPQRSGELLDVVLTGDCPCICTALVRRDLLRRLGGFDETLDYAGEELDLWLRLARLAPAARVAEPLTLIRRQAPNRSAPTAPFRNAIRALERQLAGTNLRLGQRIRCHATLSHLNAQLAGMLAVDGDHRGALRAALRALRHRPGSRAAWACAARVALHSRGRGDRAYGR